MQYLLDTHSLLWFFEDDQQLPVKVRKELVMLTINVLSVLPACGKYQ
jgi:PIN domain nuclease of toxin-antitoxin system